MERINFHGWKDSVRLANDGVELVATTAVGPRIMHLAAPGRPNLLRVEESLKGKVGPADEWVNYGGHRLWHAPEVFPRTYAPDNAPVAVSNAGDALVLSQDTEPSTGIQKTLAVKLADSGLPAVRVEHRLANRNVWPVALAPWALTVVAPGGRVILPQPAYQAHGANNDYLPARPLVMWPFTEMADPRWTWGSRYIQLRADAEIDRPQKLGVYSCDGWGAYQAPSGDLLIIFVDPDPRGPAAFVDYGSNFETFTKGDFQELETLGPLTTLEPDEEAVYVERWVVLSGDGLPADDAGLAGALAPVIAQATDIVQRAFGK